MPKKKRKAPICPFRLIGTAPGKLSAKATADAACLQTGCAWYFRGEFGLTHQRLAACAAIWNLAAAEELREIISQAKDALAAVVRD